MKSVVTSDKKPVNLLIRFFVVNKSEALLTEEFKTTIFANCQLLKSIL